MKILLAKFLTASLLLPAMASYASPICSQIHAANLPEAPAYLRIESQKGLPDSFYQQLRFEMKNYQGEARDGKKFDQLILENRGLDPSYRFPDGKSLLEIAARSDSLGYLAKRIVFAGLNPYARDSRGKSAFLDILEQREDPALKNILLILLRGGENVAPIDISQTDKAKPGAKKSPLVYKGTEEVLRMIHPEDFMIFDSQGKVTENYLEKLNTDDFDQMLRVAFFRQNRALLKYVLENMKVRAFHKDVRTFLQLALESRLAKNPERMKFSDDLLQQLIEKYSFDVNQEFSYDRGIWGGYDRMPPINALIGSRVDPEIVDLMLRRGANPQAVDKDGMNAMNWAVYIRSTQGDGRYVDLLKRHGVHMPPIVNQIFIKKPTAE
jgi:ankyrin repeat protein